MTHYPLQAKVIRTLNIEAAVFATDVTNVTVTTVRNTQLVRVNVEGISPTLVALVANTLPEIFVEELNGLKLNDFACRKRA